MVSIVTVTAANLQAECEMTLLGVKQQQESANSCFRCGLWPGCPLGRYFEPFEVRCKWFHRGCSVNNVPLFGEAISLFVAR